MKYIIGGIRFGLLVLITILFYGFYLLTLPFLGHNDRRGFNLRRFYLRIIFVLMGIRMKVLNRASETPALYVCNHRGLLDFFLTLRYVDAFILSKAEMESMPLFASASAYTGVIYVKRDDKESRGAARRAIVDCLQAGRNVFLFPEGTTYINQKTMDFKIGSFEEVAKLGFPVIPVALEYKTSRDYWKDVPTAKMYFRQYGKLFTHCKISFGPKLLNEDPKALCRDAREWIDKTLLEMHADWSKIEYVDGKARI